MVTVQSLPDRPTRRNGVYFLCKKSLRFKSRLYRYKMSELEFPTVLIHSYMFELSCRVVAESQIPTDRFHLGKIIFQALTDCPEFILQIDGATGETETSGSVLLRSIRCALALRRMGLKMGDVMVLMAPNHLDLTIPFYAALFLGVVVSADDKNLNKKEQRRSFQVTRPKIVFCQSEKADEVNEALNENGLETIVITFDKHNKFCNFSDLLNEDTEENTFKPADLDTEKAIGFLLPTSGTTGVSKMVAHTHKSFYSMLPYMWIRDTNFPSPTKTVLVLSPVQWLTGYVMMLYPPYLRVTRLQTSRTVTTDHCYELINKYKPTRVTVSPSLLNILLHPEEREKCDFSCFETINVGGAAVTERLMQEAKKVIPQAKFVNIHGATECGLYFTDATGKSSGIPTSCLLFRLVDPDTEKNITAPHITGEIWVKGPGMFKEYYNNAEETKKVFAKGGWYKTGDLFYRDEYNNFYFVERAKLMMKYKSYQVSPIEIENVIRSLTNVVDVAVTGYPDQECGELPTAFVVLRDCHATNAQDIKDLVKESLTDVKQLRGGIVFVKNIPLTSTAKVDRKALKQLVLQAKRL